MKAHMGLATRPRTSTLDAHLHLAAEAAEPARLTPTELTVIIGVVRESKPGETRVAATPATVKQLLQLGYEVVVEPEAGAQADFPDHGFVDAGATIGDAWKADVVIGINTPCLLYTSPSPRDRS